jgi:hypothetical protein
VTLPILRRVAPRTFVNRLWQTALHAGRSSALVCPACAQPFTELDRVAGGGAPQITVCVRCFWVWLGSETIAALSAPALAPPALEAAEMLDRDTAGHSADVHAGEAHRALGALAAGVLRGVIDR